MNATLLIKAVLGALMVILIQVISKTKNYYIAALVPLFPIFGLIAYYIIGSERGVTVLKNTILFGIFCLIPYFTFLIVLYFSIQSCKLEYALVIATISWVFIAIILIICWKALKMGL